MLLFKPFFVVRCLRRESEQQRFFRSCTRNNCAGKLCNHSAGYRTDNLRANDCYDYYDYYDYYNYCHDDRCYNCRYHHNDSYY